MKPTKEQIREFWEQCGLRYECYDSPASPNMGGAWVDANGKFANFDEPSEMPPIDLNNLFKYAVPKLPSNMPVMFSYFMGEAEAIFPAYFPDEEDLMSEPLSVKDSDPALALFWAIYKAFGDK